MKITLDAKWQARPLLTSVVMPFVKSSNKKRPDYDAVHEDGLAGVCIDGQAWIDPTKPAAEVIPAGTTSVELFFEAKHALDPRKLAVAYGETELKIELDRKWLRQPLQASVVVPFVAAYNKKHASPLVPTPLLASMISAVSIDDGPPVIAPELAETLQRPAALALPPAAKRIDLSFGAVAAATAGGSSGSAVGAAAGGASLAPVIPPLNPGELAAKVKLFWPKVRMTLEGLAAAREAHWTRFQLRPADGQVLGAALLAAAEVRCEGSWDTTSLGNLLTLNLEENDLRCEGIIGLVDSKALHHDVVHHLRDLFLQSNRIADRGAEALFLRSQLPQNLKKLVLQDNAIGEGALDAIASAFASKAFKVRHLNLLENRFSGDGAAAEGLRAALSKHYCEYKLPPKTAQKLPSAREQMLKAAASGGAGGYKSASEKKAALEID